MRHAGVRKVMAHLDTTATGSSTAVGVHRGARAASLRWRRSTGAPTSARSRSRTDAADDGRSTVGVRAESHVASESPSWSPRRCARRSTFTESGRRLTDDARATADYGA